MTNKKTLFYGWYSQSNIGDEMYKIAFPMLFPERDNRFVSVLTKEDVEWSDEVVIGGGNIIDKFFLTNANNMVKNKPLHFYSVGCTDLSVTASQLNSFHTVWVRDVMTYKKLNGMGVMCDLAPDASWVLSPNIDRGSKLWEDLFAAQDRDLYEKRVVVVLNSHLTSAQPDLLARDLARFDVFTHDMVNIIDHTNASFAFLPFGRRLPWDDRVANSWVAHKCKWHAKNAVVWDEWGVQETLDFVSAADAMISQRLHSTIFATIGGTPFLDVTHHDKNRGFLSSVGLEDWGVNYWDFPREKSKQILDDLITDHKSNHRKLQTIANRERRALLDHTRKMK
jgi:polysaccharide pyruvyl transferase WcaK-like protein